MGFSFSFTKFINIPILIISFIVGLFFVYNAMNSDMRKIIVYPTPENINKIQYKDNNNNCYVFEQEKVKCSSSKQKNVVLPQ